MNQLALKRPIPKTARPVTAMSNGSIRPLQLRDTPPLDAQRACSCGGGCPSCKAKTDLLDEGHFEQEADTAANRIMGTSRSPTPPGSDTPVPPSDFNARLTGEMDHGQALHPSIRPQLERGFARSLDDVRVHDNPASHNLSHDLQARAFTHGSHIFFGRGHLNPSTPKGRHLIAHEVAHTTQPGAGQTIRRAPLKSEESATAGVEASPRIDQQDVHLIIIESPTGASDLIQYTNLEAGSYSHRRAIFLNDTIHITVDSDYGNISGPINVRFETPGIFERADTPSAEPEIILRVLAEPATAFDTRIYLTSPDVDGEMTAAFMLGILPLDIDPVKDTKKRHKAEKRALKDAQRTERKKLKADRKKGDPNRDFKTEMKTLRSNQKDAGHDLKETRRPDIRAARKSHKADVATSYNEHGIYGCTENQRQTVTDAMREAIGKIESALAKLDPSESPNKKRVSALKRAFNLDVGNVSAEEIARVQQKAVDVLNIARTSMYLSNPAQVQCGAPPDKCKPQVGARVQRNLRGKPVTVCQIWIDDHLGFDVTKYDSKGNRAYALIHEFAHLAGVTGAGAETYLHESGWESISPKQAESMADAYSSFCWLVASES